MISPEDKKFLFIHVMKTGGTSFADIIATNFPAYRRYPDVCIEVDADMIRRMEAYLFVPGLVEAVNALDGQLHMVRGHVPYAVRSLLHDSYIALTLLRNPVERTLSYLKHCRRYHAEHLEQDLEKIYEDAWFNATFIRNYQTKIFSMSPEEALAEDRLVGEPPALPPRHALRDENGFVPEFEILRKRSPGRVSLEAFAASTGVIQVDDRRLVTARENLSAVEVVGVTEHYDRFLKRLTDKYAWKIKSVPHRHYGEDDTISREFRKRIARDNEFDMELYDYACALASR